MTKENLFLFPRKNVKRNEGFFRPVFGRNGCNKIGMVRSINIPAYRGVFICCVMP